MEERRSGVARQGVAKGDGFDLVGGFCGEFALADVDAKENGEIGFFRAVVEFARSGADHAEAGFFPDLTTEGVDEGFGGTDFSAGECPEFAAAVLFDHEDFAGGVLDPGHGGNLLTGFFGWNNDRGGFSNWHFGG